MLDQGVGWGGVGGSVLYYWEEEKQDKWCDSHAGDVPLDSQWVVKCMESMPARYATKLTGTPVAGTVTTQDNLLQRVAGWVVTVVMDESGHSLVVGGGTGGGGGWKGGGRKGAATRCTSLKKAAAVKDTTAK